MRGRDSEAEKIHYAFRLKFGMKGKAGKGGVLQTAAGECEDSEKRGGWW